MHASYSIEKSIRIIATDQIGSVNTISRSSWVGAGRKLSQNSMACLFFFQFLFFLPTTCAGQTIYYGVWDTDLQSPNRPQPDDQHNLGFEPRTATGRDELGNQASLPNAFRPPRQNLDSESGYFPAPQPPPTDTESKTRREPPRVPVFTPASDLIPASPDQDEFTDLSRSPHAESIPDLSSPNPSSNQFGHFSQAPFESEPTKPQAAEIETEIETTSFEESVATTTSLTTPDNLNSQQTPLGRAKQRIARFQFDTNASTRDSYSRPVRLLELIKQPNRLEQRAEMIEQYWETWSLWAEQQSQIEFANWLNSISALVSNTDQQPLQASQSFARNQLEDAQSALLPAQAQLQSFLPLEGTSTGTLPPPLPADRPLIHQYVTNYQLYRNYRSLPARFQTIDADLADTLNLIGKLGDAADQAKSSADSQLNRYRNGQDDLSSALDAGRAWRAADRELIQAVARYNQQIADYSLNITDGSQAPETVVAMLIGQSASRLASAESAAEPPWVRSADNSSGQLQPQQNPTFQPPVSTPDQSRELLGGSTNPFSNPSQSLPRSSAGTLQPNTQPAIHDRSGQPASEPFQPLGDSPSFGRPAAQPLRPAPASGNNPSTQLPAFSGNSGLKEPSDFGANFSPIMPPMGAANSGEAKSGSANSEDVNFGNASFGLANPSASNSGNGNPGGENSGGAFSGSSNSGGSHSGAASDFDPSRN